MRAAICTFRLTRRATALGGFVLSAFVGLPAHGQLGQLPDLDPVLTRLPGADIVLLGEVHDNPTHHHVQAAIIAELSPKALVWEMLSDAQVELLTPEVLAAPERIGPILDWEASGWPAYPLYQPVFEAAGDAQHIAGGVPRQAAREAIGQGVASYFGPRASEFGLDLPLPLREQTAREADQLTAHCDALPLHLLAPMVDIQRLRDATLARAAADALAETGGPVAVITGNGHARRDRGVPVYLQAAAPEATVLAVGQAEVGQISGTFDVVLSADAVARPDPCAAFH